MLGQDMTPPLTDLGVRQAERAASELVASGAKTIWCSDQVRAIQTAEIIGGRLGIEPVKSPLLREQDWGILEGKLPSELTAEPVPEGKHISEVAWGGGESVADVAARLSGFVPILSESGDPAIVVGHADCLKILRTLLLGGGHRDVEWVKLGYGQALPVVW